MPSRNLEGAVTTEPEVRREVVAAFPDKPIMEPSLLSARATTLQRCRDVIDGTGRTLVLFGDYGVGKTSIWQVLLHDRKYEKVLAVPNTSVAQLFQQILGRHGLGTTLATLTNQNQFTVGAEFTIPTAVKMTGSHGFNRSVEAVPLERLRLDVSVLIDELKKLRGAVDFIVVEQAHRITDPTVREDLVHLSKAVFDEPDLPLGLIIVGSTTDGPALLESPEFDQVLNRAIHVVEVPLFTKEEMMQLLSDREKRLGMKFTGHTKEAIAHVSAGYPYVANSIARYACLRQVVRLFANMVTSVARKGFSAWLSSLFSERGEASAPSIHVTWEDFESAVRILTQNSDQDSVVWYRELLLNNSDDARRMVLLTNLLSEFDGAVPMAQVCAKLGVPAEVMVQTVSTFGGGYVVFETEDRIMTSDQHLRWFPRAMRTLSGVREP